MKNLNRLLVSSMLTGTFALASPNAHATESTRGPGYVQGNILGFAMVGASAGGFTGTSGGFPIDFQAGYHFSGRHDGFVLGGVQKFFFASGTTGATAARGGWDIPIAIKDMELTIAPYALAGILYGFSGGDPRAYFGPGVEARFFPLNEGAGKGFFATARPFELIFAPGSGGLLYTYTFNAGAGYAF